MILKTHYDGSRAGLIIMNAVRYNCIIKECTYSGGNDMYVVIVGEQKDIDNLLDHVEKVVLDFG